MLCLSIVNDVYMEKGLFVRYQLCDLVQKIDKDVLRLDYTNDKRAEEFVTITYKNFEKRKVCVTADSLLGITIDVLRIFE